MGSIALENETFMMVHDSFVKFCADAEECAVATGSDEVPSIDLDDRTYTDTDGCS